MEAMAVVLKIGGIIIAMLLGRLWYFQWQAKKLDRERKQADAFIKTQEIVKHNEKTPLKDLIHEFDNELESDRKRDS